MTMVMVVMLIVNGVLMMTDGDEKVDDDGDADSGDDAGDHIDHDGDK